MKKIIKTTAYFLFIALFVTACKDDEETFSTFEPPVWQVNYGAGYYENMTAIVKIPAYLALYANENDQLAAFASDGSCRGIGQLINGAYYVSIQGVPEDQTGIYFQYYSARNKYLYKTADLFEFDSALMFGTPDAPRELPLNVVQ